MLKHGECIGVILRMNKPNKVNKVLYILLAAFGGTFGLHKLYAGKGWHCFCYLITSWTGLPTVFGLVEAGIAYMKTADRNGDIYV